MKIFSKQFEQSLHRAARREINLSPAWRQTYRWTYFSHPSPRFWVIFVTLPFLALLGMFAWLAGTGTGEPKPSFQIAFNLYATALLITGHMFWTQLRMAHQGSGQRLPLPPSALFQSAHRRFLGTVLALSLLGSYALLVLGKNFSGEWRPGPALVGGLIYGLTLVACGYPLSLCQSFRRPQQPQTQPGIRLSLTRLVPFYLLLFGPRLVAENAEWWGIIGWLEPLARALPGGWTGNVFFTSLAGKPLDWGAHLLPLAALLASIPLWHRLLRARFCSLPSDYQFTRPTKEEGAPAMLDAEPLAAVRTGLNQPANWFRRGVVERLVGLWLRPEERRLAEAVFTVTSPRGWTVDLRNLILMVVVALAAGSWCQAQRTKPMLILAMLCYGLAVLFLLVHSVINCGFGKVGLPCSLPVAPRDYGRVWMKAISLRALVSLPVYVLTGVVLEAMLWRTMKPFVPALACLCLLAVVLAPLGPVFRLVNALVSTRWWHWGKNLVIVPFIFIPALLPAFGVVLALKYDMKAVALAALAAWLVLWCLHELVLWAYERGKFDVSAGTLLIGNSGASPAGMRVTIR